MLLIPHPTKAKQTKPKTAKTLSKVNLFSLTLLGSLFFLASCQNPQTKNLNGPLLSSTQYSAMLQTASASDKIGIQLRLIAALINENNLAVAQQELSKLPAEMQVQEQVEKLLLTAELANKQGQFSTTQSTLKGLKFPQLSDEQKRRYATALVGSYNNQANIELVRAYVLLAEVATDTEKQQLANDTWRALANIHANQMRNVVINSDEFILQGWLELRTIYDNYGNNPDNAALKDTALQNWRARNPHNLGVSHFPTNFLTPGAMPQSAQNSTLIGINNDAKIALLLPLSGNKQTRSFSDAIQAGFTSAKNGFTFQPSYSLDSNSAGMQIIDSLVGSDNQASQPMQEDYQYSSNTMLNDASVKVFDTSSQDIFEILTQAEQAGMTTVVGPLLKPDVEKLANYTGNLQVLALNVPETLSPSMNICYFALSPEDEASAAAKHMWEQGKRSPIVLVPHGNLGTRIADAFGQAWQQLGGGAAYMQVLPEQSDLRNMLNMRGGLGLSGERIASSGSSDSGAIDAVYVIAEPEKLLLLKPMLDAANTSGNRPQIYASSRSHQNSLGPDFRLEMEGVQFSEIPLLANQNPEQLKTVAHEFSSDYSLIRLYAMGMDAWQLSQNFTPLSNQYDFAMQGATGMLHTSQNCEVTRDLVWLQFKEGLVRTVE